MFLSRVFKRTKPIKLGRWNYNNAERKIDLANVDHCGTCELTSENKIKKHFEKKGKLVKLAACEINEDNKKWRESKYHRCGDDVILL
jgi:hypothetical protein